MKKIKFIALATILIIFTGTMVIINSCTKNNLDVGIQKSIVNEGSQAMTTHILAFKAKMEYYRQNPNIKTGGELYTADSAVLELESLLNFDFCYTNIECKQKAFVTSEVTMPLDELEKINDPDLMQVYYNKVIDTIQAQMGRVDYENMKLLLVDLEVTGTDSNGDAIVCVGSLIGNEETVILHDDSWWYGHLMGTCSYNYSGTDAAKQLEARVTNAMVPDPPTGCHWYYTNIDTLMLDPLDYPLDPTPDNYEDYKIYYAHDAVANGLTFDVKCLSGAEMAFYKNHYIDLATETEIQYGKDFNSCLIFGNDYRDPDDDLYIQHDYQLHIGHRHIECSAIVDDILAY